MIEVTLLTSTPYMNLPYNLVGWAGWAWLLIVILWGWKKSWQKPVVKNRSQLAMLLLLLLAAFLTSLFLGINIPGLHPTVLPNVPVETSAPLVVLLCAVPWVMAGGIFGSWAAVPLAIIAGTLYGFFGTHSIFTPLEYAGLALATCALMRQDHRTFIYRLARHPAGAALLVSLAYAPVYIFSTFFAASGSLAVRLDYSFTQTWPMMAARGVELLAAGLVSEIFLFRKSPLWYKPAALKPSPAETSLQTKILVVALPLVLILVLSLMITDWVVAGNAARQMIEERLGNTARVAGSNIPYFFETGQSLLLDLAQPGLMELAPERAQVELEQGLRSVPFFRQLSLFHPGGAFIAGYPYNKFEQLRITQEEQAGIALAKTGLPMQIYPIQAWPGENTAQITFIAAIMKEGQTTGILVGRTDLGSNLFTQPVVQSMTLLAETGGEGIVLDENRRILFHTTPSLVMTEYAETVPDGALFFDETSTTGTRRLVYYQPVREQGWGILVSVPANVAQETALRIAIPLLIMSLTLSLLTVLLLRWMANRLVSSLTTLSDRASEIASGSLKSPVDIHGVDEIGRLGEAFEQMRANLKSRLEELDCLLEVSQGIASSLVIEESMLPLLNAALSKGAHTARVVLDGKAALSETSSAPLVQLGVEGVQPAYEDLDAAVFEMMKTRDLEHLPNRARIKRSGFSSNQGLPSALTAISLRKGGQYFGALWVAYTQSHRFDEEEMRFYQTLAVEATIAAANASLFVDAQTGRQRLNSVLDATPEPVLVVDSQERLILANPAAVQVPGLLTCSETGVPLPVAVAEKAVVALIASANLSEPVSCELETGDGKVWYASISPIMAEGQFKGKVCILRDISNFKALEKMKSEFVTTVSHDLREPLSVMKGYASLLANVGEMNNRQHEYLDKIIAGLEEMHHLVSNILDLNRIEGVTELKFERLRPGDVMEAAMGMVQPRAAQNKIAIQRDISLAQDIIIEADRALLQQALYNLLDNAIKFNAINGQVIAALQTSDDEVIFEIQDKGRGIAPLDMPHIFDQFKSTHQKGDEPKRGSGLGLAIVKSIAERHGGKVWAESNLGKGSSFYLKIPKKHLSPAA